jgi:hypothetical protein
MDIKLGGHSTRQPRQRAHRRRAVLGRSGIPDGAGCPRSPLSQLRSSNQSSAAELRKQGEVTNSTPSFAALFSSAPPSHHIPTGHQEASQSLTTVPRRGTLRLSVTLARTGQSEHAPHPRLPEMTRCRSTEATQPPQIALVNSQLLYLAIRCKKRAKAALLWPNARPTDAVRSRENRHMAGFAAARRPICAHTYRPSWRTGVAGVWEPNVGQQTARGLTAVHCVQTAARASPHRSETRP